MVFLNFRKAKETRMNETEIEQFRLKLLSLRSELQKIKEPSIDAVSPVESDQADSARLSRRGAMQAQLIADEAVRGPKRQLGKIEGALRRIEAGDYGNCFMCDEEIENHRISEDPTCTRCIKCVER
jgi:DnaK suppressor protein